jgi:SOS-response transcriptional repressor LexA
MEPSTCLDSEPFALRVTDASMAPEFPPGCIVIVDPGAPARDGSYVLAELPDGYVLRRLCRSRAQLRLQALDARYPHIELDLPADGADAAFRRIVQGVIVQRAGPRRRDHKHYA